MFHDDLINGPGVRVTLFLSGCNHGCKGCYNTASWNPDNGVPFDEGAYQALAAQLSKPYVRGLSLSGGDPLFDGNVVDTFELVRRVKKEFPDKDIWMWTGYTLEEIRNGSGADWMYRRMTLQFTDGLVDGKFEQDNHVPGLKFRGSTNQNVWMKDGNGDFHNATLAQDG